MKLTGAQILCESLLKEGVDVIFGFPGGKVIPLFDTLMQYPQLRHILVRHEQGAAHAADGYARATGKVGVCLATSGPGATNLVTGIANAHLDSVPIIAITGQVERPVIGRMLFRKWILPVLLCLSPSIIIWSLEASQLARVIKEAFYLAQTGRPGPILIDIPVDVFTEKAEYHYPEVDLPGYNPNLQGHPVQIKEGCRR